MKKLPVIILLVYLGAIFIHTQIHKTFRYKSSTFSQMLYLPTAKYLKPVSFGYYSLVADLIYLWSIQYYGDPEFGPKMEYLNHTYQIITELDPMYIDAYQTGALFMFFEGRNHEAGLALLEKGFEKNPKEWIFLVDAGFYCMMNLKDNQKAAQYFQRAAAVPGAPSQAKRLAAGMHFRLGDRIHAYEIWKEIYETSSKPAIKQTAYQHMHDLKILIDVDSMEKALSEFKIKKGNYPSSLEILVLSGLLKEIPLDPDGEPYVYNSQTGEVKYSKELSIYKRYQ